jgi:predicted alpha/beta-hydrolase family hydrolase
VTSEPSLSTVSINDVLSVSIIRHEPEGDAGWTFIYAPGAGANLQDPFGKFAGERLSSRGVACVRMQFPYQEVGKKSPDRNDILEDTWRAVIEALRPADGRLVVGGRSMGGRIASQVVAQGVAVDALALFAYPLHAPGKPDQVRDSHFTDIAMPVLFCSGSRDAFASPEELALASAKIPNSTVHIMEAADHGFNAPKSSGSSRADIWSEAVIALTHWLLRLD